MEDIQIKNKTVYELSFLKLDDGCMEACYTILSTLMFEISHNKNSGKT